MFLGSLDHWTTELKFWDFMLKSTKADAFEPTGFATGHVDVRYLNLEKQD